MLMSMLHFVLGSSLRYILILDFSLIIIVWSTDSPNLPISDLLLRLAHPLIFLGYLWGPERSIQDGGYSVLYCFQVQSRMTDANAMSTTRRNAETRGLVSRSNFFWRTDGVGLLFLECGGLVSGPRKKNICEPKPPVRNLCATLICSIPIVLIYDIPFGTHLRRQWWNHRTGEEVDKRS